MSDTNLKVTGFTFIRNAIRYDYPIVEAVRSILPLCDEVVVAVGQSEDETLELVKSIDPQKVRIIETVWDESLREGGRVLADETNKAYAAIPLDRDWCFYIQGDEVLHEQYLDTLRKAMLEHRDNPQVEGLLFNYRHFYGSYDYIGDARWWYRREVRIIRRNPVIQSYRDAQGFRKNQQKLKVKATEAYIHHYGWVKHPRHQQLKQLNFNKLWHSDEWVDENIPPVDNFDYSQIDSLQRFTGTHPEVIQERIARMNWQFNYDPSKKKLNLKERFSRWLERQTGYRIGEYRNYRLV